LAMARASRRRGGAEAASSARPAYREGIQVTWHGQINRTIWEIRQLVEKNPKDFELKRELLRTHFLQRFEFDRSHHIPRDDRSFLFLQDDRAPGCLLLHGGKGTPAEMRDLGNFLYSKGFTVVCPRFSRMDLKDRPASWESWVTLADSIYGTIADYSRKSVVVGLSLGGLVALVLARLHKISALVLLAPAVVPKISPRERLLLLTRHLVPTLSSRLSGWEGEVFRAAELLRKDEREIASPALVLQARDDRTLSTKGLKLLRKWLTHADSEVVLLPHGSHAITRGKSKDEVFERITGFTERLGIVGPSE
jgi:carboxylesterase